ncbi:hypothetical protein Tco_1504108 [Tanacetum coccineum]
MWKTIMWKKDKTKAIIPFYDYHDYEINDTQSSTEDVEYNDNVSGVTHVIDEANKAGASNAVDNMTQLPLISGALKEVAHDVPPVDARPSFNKLKLKLKRNNDGTVHAKNIDDVSCAAEKGSVNAVEVPAQKVINATKDKTV